MSNLVKLKGSDTVKSIVNTYNSNIDSISKSISSIVSTMNAAIKNSNSTCTALNGKINAINNNISSIDDRIAGIEAVNSSKDIIDGLIDAVGEISSILSDQDESISEIKGSCEVLSSKQERLISGNGIVIDENNIISCEPSFEFVDDLSSVDGAANRVYLVLVESGEYEQYVWVNGEWKKVGYIDLSNCVDLESEQYITGVKHFKSVPVFEAGVSMSNTRLSHLKAPETNNDAANKKYGDNEISRLEARMKELIDSLCNQGPIDEAIDSF